MGLEEPKFGEFAIKRDKRLKWAALLNSQRIEEVNIHVLWRVKNEINWSPLSSTARSIVIQTSFSLL